MEDWSDSSLSPVPSNLSNKRSPGVSEEDGQRRRTFIDSLTDRAHTNLPRRVQDTVQDASVTSSDVPFAYPKPLPQTLPADNATRKDPRLRRRAQEYRTFGTSQSSLSQQLPPENPDHFNRKTTLHTQYVIKRVSTSQCDECRAKGKGEEIFKCTQCVKQICHSCMKGLIKRERNAQQSAADRKARGLAENDDDEYIWKWQGEYRHRGFKMCFEAREAAKSRDDFKIDVPISLVSPGDVSGETITISMAYGNDGDEDPQNKRPRPESDTDQSSGSARSTTRQKRRKNTIPRSMPADYTSINETVRRNVLGNVKSEQLYSIEQAAEKGSPRPRSISRPRPKALNLEKAQPSPNLPKVLHARKPGPGPKFHYPPQYEKAADPPKPAQFRPPQHSANQWAGIDPRQSQYGPAPPLPAAMAQPAGMQYMGPSAMFAPPPETSMQVRVGNNMINMTWDQFQAHMQRSHQPPPADSNVQPAQYHRQANNTNLQRSPGVDLNASQTYQGREMTALPFGGVGTNHPIVMLPNIRNRMAHINYYEADDNVAVIEAALESWQMDRDAGSVEFASMQTRSSNENPITVDSDEDINDEDEEESGRPRSAQNRPTSTLLPLSSPPAAPLHAASSPAEPTTPQPYRISNNPHTAPLMRFVNPQSASQDAATPTRSSPLRTNNIPSSPPEPAKPAPPSTPAQPTRGSTSLQNLLNASYFSSPSPPPTTITTNNEARAPLKPRQYHTTNNHAAGTSSDETTILSPYSLANPASQRQYPNPNSTSLTHPQQPTTPTHPPSTPLHRRIHPSTTNLNNNNQPPLLSPFGIPPTPTNPQASPNRTPTTPRAPALRSPLPYYAAHHSPGRAETQIREDRDEARVRQRMRQLLESLPEARELGLGSAASASVGGDGTEVEGSAGDNGDGNGDARRVRGAGGAVLGGKRRKTPAAAKGRSKTKTPARKVKREENDVHEEAEEDDGDAMSMSSVDTPGHQGHGRGRVLGDDGDEDEDMDSNEEDDDDEDGDGDGEEMEGTPLSMRKVLLKKKKKALMETPTRRTRSGREYTGE